LANLTLNAYSLPRNFGFGGVSTLKHYRSLSRPPKGTSLCEPASYEPSCVKIGSVVFATGDDKQKGQERKGKERYKKSQTGYISRNCREAPCEQILTTFRTSRDMADIIICVKFVFFKLRGYRYTEVKTLVSPFETAGHPYNSAALRRSLRDVRHLRKYLPGGGLT